jgi:hypothetical protein
MLRYCGRFKTPMVLGNWSKRFASEEIASGRRKRTQSPGFSVYAASAGNGLLSELVTSRRNGQRPKGSDTFLD